jgi:DNA polymerase I-like protein with 3'-5' exonuclease and polymerase domains
MFDLEIAAYIMNPSKSSYKLDDIIMEELNIIVENKKQIIPETIRIQESILFLI